MKSILTVNAGSSSLKASLYVIAEGKLNSILSYTASRLLETGAVKCKLSESGEVREYPLDMQEGELAHPAAIRGLLSEIETLDGEYEVVAVSHRIVHGGNYNKPQVLTSDVMAELRAKEPLAPLHQPHNLAMVQLMSNAFPEAEQVGCFDTMFHAQDRGFIRENYAIPKELRDQGVKRYGFHGLSYEYISKALKAEYPELAKGRVIVAHLGSGASLCAIHDGKPVLSTMGFSAVDGLPMGTRTGCLDPGILLYLLDHLGWSTDQVEAMLYKNSGIKGLSGLSGDFKAVLDADSAEADQAIEYFCHWTAYHMAGLAQSMGGLDTVVFTAGVGEKSPEIRSLIMASMEWQGFKLNEMRNAVNHRGVINTVHSNKSVILMSTNEELVLAEHASELLR
ncbi:acetate/propionate family kinase [Neptuniibacter sp. QD37_11]|uniref:acetate/propionate family kinase n=1 Tax=Neptuniibacter sp. QD37_11 TaxID=3398209 RepID=UPI0039F4D1EF